MRFEPILKALRRMQAQGHYRGVVAVEPFDYVPDGPGCAARSIGYLQGIVESLDGHE
jgi:D-psicose/D-tagatose/L-ribulose 3-epimerase